MKLSGQSTTQPNQTNMTTSNPKTHLAYCIVTCGHLTGQKLHIACDRYLAPGKRVMMLGCTLKVLTCEAKA